jgi:hypothetical protein
MHVRKSENILMHKGSEFPTLRIIRRTVLISICLAIHNLPMPHKPETPPNQRQNTLDRVSIDQSNHPASLISTVSSSHSHPPALRPAHSVANRKHSSSRHRAKTSTSFSSVCTGVYGAPGRSRRLRDQIMPATNAECAPSSSCGSSEGGGKGCA